MFHIVIKLTHNDYPVSIKDINKKNHNAIMLHSNVNRVVIIIHTPMLTTHDTTCRK